MFGQDPGRAARFNYGPGPRLRLFSFRVSWVSRGEGSGDGRDSRAAPLTCDDEGRAAVPRVLPANKRF